MFRRLDTERGAAHIGCAPDRRGVLASLCAALLAIPIILACGATPITISTAAASALSLDINIQDQYAAKPEVTVGARVQLAHQTGFYVLSASHTLTCDGIAIPIVTGPAQVPRFPTVAAVPYATGNTLVLRQPPGGAYTFVYTDERGQRSTLVVPVPLGRFAVTSPSAGANVELPRAPAIVATASSQPRTPDQASQPPILIRYELPSLPANASTSVQVTADCGRLGEPGFESCSVEGPTLGATGVYALTDEDTPLNAGFEDFPPGPGEFAVNVVAAWPLPPSGFASAQVAYYDQIYVPVTWTR